MPAEPRNSWLLSIVGRAHRRFVSARRARVLAELLAAQIPPRSSVLDIGCGDGAIASGIIELRPDITIQGVEFLVRSECKIPCSAFDGKTLPFPENSFDVCLFVDVLHHTTDISALLREAVRVARSFVLIKDHLDENRLDHLTLRSMDWVGNRPHGVRLPFNYQSRVNWLKLFSIANIAPVNWLTEVPLYPPPLSLVLGRRLHFVSLLKKNT
ncbi:MAG: hypothetical protein NVS9B4_09870 [Candidatus Acidiferrum sp.]